MFCFWKPVQTAISTQEVSDNTGSENQPEYSFNLKYLVVTVADSC